MTEPSEIAQICEFASNLDILQARSQQITDKTVASISSLEEIISSSHSKVADIFGRIEQQELAIKNMSQVVRELDILLELFGTINQDKLKIGQGPQGAFNEFIQKLLFIKSVEQYHWIRELAGLPNAKNFRVLLGNYELLLAQGERVLVQEFQDVVKHYSNAETLEFFVEHLTSRFETADMFIPKETVHKLEEICWW